MVHFDRVVIVGVGLLGGSIGLALRNRKLAETIVGVGRDASSLDKALELGAITESDTDVLRACADAELAIICTPVQQIAEFARACKPAMRPAGLITDVGSTKGTICTQMQESGGDTFCGSHPLAGSDKSGVAFADVNLFDGKLTIVTPTDNTPTALIERTEALWRALGSRTIRMSPAEHDRAIAKTSHLPHLVAATLAGITPTELLPLAASGWCDTTRVASGNVELWRQIISENRGPVLEAMRGFASSLDSWIETIERLDDAALTQLLQTGKQQRDSVGN
jgi:prephenate dehydrogenase